MPEVRAERTHWRDLRLNDRHRLWGYDCPAENIDFINFIEYDMAKARGLIEYSLDNLKRYDANSQALEDVGNRARLPVFRTLYTQDFSEWIVIPVNEISKYYLRHESRMKEKEYVSLLYEMRSRSLPNNLFDQYGNLIKKRK